MTSVAMIDIYVLQNQYFLDLQYIYLSRRAHLWLRIIELGENVNQI